MTYDSIGIKLYAIGIKFYTKKFKEMKREELKKPKEKTQEKLKQ